MTSLALGFVRVAESPQDFQLREVEQGGLSKYLTYGTCTRIQDGGLQDM